MKFEEWAEKEMDEMGLDPEEYCNANGYNWDEIIKEDE